MADEILKRDQNEVPVLAGITDDANQYVTMLRVDPTTKRLLVKSTAAGGGTVTSITASTGILLTPDPITTTGTVGLSTALAPMATLTGNSLKVLRVNAGETAVEYATISSGLTVGTTPIASGTVGAVLFEGAGNVLQEDATNFFWDDTNNRLGIGTNTPYGLLNLSNVGTTAATQFINLSSSFTGDSARKRIAWRELS